MFLIFNILPESYYYLFIIIIIYLFVRIKAVNNSKL